MVNQILGLVLCVGFLFISYGKSEKENNEAICSSDACYTVHLNTKTFTDAHKECTDRRGNLLTIHDEEEAGHVRRLLRKFTNTTKTTRPLKLWIGLKLNSCVDINKALKGFFWITDPQHTKEDQFSNWLTEPMRTCIKERCVSMKLQMNSTDNYKWTDTLCSSLADGYMCKFNMYGMCRRIVLEGPGHVEYETPFEFKSSTLDLIPYGSAALVSCGHNKEHTEPLLYCLTTNETNVYQWENSDMRVKSDGPFCASEELDCKYNNGGCEHECVEYPQNKSVSCRCRDGYVLAPNLVSCVSPDHCKSNPCEQKCINHHSGFECLCFSGFVLAENQINCNNIEGCVKGECEPEIIDGYKNEEMEAEYNDTSSSIHRENGPQATSHSIIDREKEKMPKTTQTILMPSVKTASPSVISVKDTSDCSAPRPGSKLLSYILYISVVLFFYF
ncbi:complement component C1q receptor-like [Hyla sarda]|uniref:complement component C1q receptor-like n=1 Tax=Hyla sarda TaxID=327740 RepID=UPI0024C415D2|nr:complement component C1q receptor-like [Hyla sarda]